MKIFIGASARDEIEEKYKEEGETLAKYLLKHDHKIIICADERGTIGELYRLFIEKKKENIILTVPKVYEKYAKGIPKDVDILTETINERTNQSIQEADVCLFLPGGIGTIYEILSTIETKRAGEHSKPIIIVNSYGFFDKLLEMLEEIYQKDFANTSDKKQYQVVESMEKAIELLNYAK